MKPGEGEDYLALLAQRLTALASGAFPNSTVRERRLARAFLRSRMAWHDGDENLVRGWIEAGRDDPGRALVHAADELTRIHPRPETIWFYLWLLESELDGGE